MTDMINHHLTDSFLIAYAAGSLPEAFNLMVATHLSLCDDCRARAESYDALGGEVLEQMQDTHSTPLGPESLKETLTLIASSPTDVPRRTPPPVTVLPTPLRDYVGGDLDAIHWKSLGMGAKQAILNTSKDASARLLLIPAGAAMPNHGHNGTEMTMVLQGAFQDDGGYFARGDVETAGSDMHHMPVADIHEDCICLAVTDAPLHFDGLIQKIAQRFLRI